MGEWAARLEGHKFDLQALAAAFATDSPKVTEQDGNYVLRAREFEALTDAGEVRAKASEIVRSLNGLGRALLNGFERVAVSGVTLIESEIVRHHYVTFDVNVGIRSNMTADLQGGTEAATGKSDLQALFNLTRDTAVAKALRIFGSGDLDWRDLYVVFEVIEGDAGKALRDGDWASEAVVRNFKHTANSVGTLGDAARHGKESTLPPRNPTSLDDARSLVRTLLDCWLDWKGQSYGP